MSRESPVPPEADAAPEGALSDVWVLLDELPRGAASPMLTATTIEMAAVAVDPRGAAGGPGAGRRAWLGPAAVVATALVVGAVAGRVTAPDPDRSLLEHLAVVRHIDLLQEAGSVTFLEAAAGRGGPPLRMVLRQGPEAARQDAAAFNAKLESLRRLAWADTASRREFVAGLPVEERAELARSLRGFAALSAAERKTLAAVAEALADPDRENLRAAARDWHRWLASSRPEDRDDIIAIRAAARDWHRWLASSRPEDRDDIIASNTDKRLEWIDWYAARIEGRFRRPPDGPPREPPSRPFRPDRPAPPPETRAAPG